MAEKARREGWWRGDDDVAQNPFARTAKRRQAFAVLGPAGSGKTTATQHAIETACQRGARILVTAPTGRLAATLRSKYPHLDVDTVHGAFLIFKPVQQTLELMFPYDLIIVEEVGQLSRNIFERLIQIWEAAEQLPTLVFVGDFWQLPGVEPTKASDSPLWHSARVAKRELKTLRRCKCETLKRKLQILRTGKPSVRQLHFILTGHIANRPSTSS